MSQKAQSEMNRLRTFEIDEDEQLVVMAGRGEMDQRFIYRGPASGRFAIVPIEEIETSWQRPDHADKLDVEGLEVVGESATVDPGEQSTMTLLENETIVEQSSTPGVYGLMRISFETD